MKMKRRRRLKNETDPEALWISGDDRLVCGRRLLLSLPSGAPAAAEPIIARKPKSFRIRFILQPPPPLHLHPLREYHACRSSCHRTPTLRDYPSCRLPGYPCSAPQSPAPGICIPDRSEPSTGSTLPHPCLGSVLPPTCPTPEPYRPYLSGCQRGN